MSTCTPPRRPGPRIMLRFCRNCGDRAKLSKGLCRLCAPTDFTHMRPSNFSETPAPVVALRRCNMCDERMPASDFVGEMCGPCHRNERKES